MRESLPEGVTEIGPAIDVVIQRVSDPDFIDSLMTLQKQRDEKLKARPEDKQQIIREYKEGVNELVLWFEHTRVRWTIAEAVDPTISR